MFLANTVTKIQPSPGNEEGLTELNTEAKGWHRQQQQTEILKPQLDKRTKLVSKEIGHLTQLLELPQYQSLRMLLDEEC